MIRAKAVIFTSFAMDACLPAESIAGGGPRRKPGPFSFRGFFVGAIQNMRPPYGRPFLIRINTKTNQ